MGLLSARRKVNKTDFEAICRRIKLLCTELSTSFHCEKVQCHLKHQSWLSPRRKVRISNENMEVHGTHAW